MSPKLVAEINNCPTFGPDSSTPTSVGIHRQPCLSGTASKETGTWYSSHMSHDISFHFNTESAIERFNRTISQQRIMSILKSAYYQ